MTFCVHNLDTHLLSIILSYIILLYPLILLQTKISSHSYVHNNIVVIYNNYTSIITRLL